MKKERSGSTLSMNSRRRVREAPGVNQKRKEEGEGTRNRKKLWPGIFKRKENFGIRKSFGQQGKLCNVPDVIGPMGVRCRITGVCQGVFMAAIVAYGFYRSMAAFALLLIPACGYLWIYQKSWREKRLLCLEQQFKEAIGILAGLLHAGYSAENAIIAGCGELEQLYGPEEMIVREFVYMREQMNLNRSVEQVIQDFARRSGLEEAERFSQIIQIAKCSGGQLTPVICHTVSIMEDKSQVKEEIRTMSASVQFEQKVMMVIPFLMILYIDATSPGFFAVMYETVFGRLVMSGCLAMYLLSCYLSRKILDIPIG